ncbi:MAG: type II toxin-antitoxin system HicB family antitoxin [Bacteroidales bacterium]|nr:type II toxin-antitoxin system HicB family antitoxin [Bacteroidales bacterium]
MGTMYYKGYHGSIEYSDTDECFHGSVLGLRHDGIIFEGKSVEELRNDFEGAVDYYLEGCAENGKTPEKPYSGKMVLRMESNLHGDAAERAAKLGISLNEFITRAIKGALGQ